MREWVVGLVGEGLAPFVTTIVAAAIVILLLLIVVWVARKALGGAIGPKGKGRGPRLAVMDVSVVDQKRKLVLVRRDEVEHLLLIGGQNDLVVEAGILRVPAAARTQRLEPSLRAEPEAAERTGAAPRPAPLRPAESQTPTPRPAPSRPHPSADSRNAEVRAASPLTRAVPRAPVAAPPIEAPAAVAPVVAPPVVAEAPRGNAVPSVEPVAANRDPEPAPAVTADVMAPAGHQEPSISLPAEPVVAAAVAPATMFPDLSPRRPASPARTAPPVSISEPEAAERGPAPVEPVNAPVAAPVVAPPVAAESASPSAPPVPDVEPTETVEPEAAPAPVADGPAPRVEAEPRAPSRPAGNGTALPVRRPLMPQRTEPPAIPTGAAAEPTRSPVTADPFRRPAFTASTSTQRSMATPTYPQRAAPSTDEPVAAPATPSQSPLPSFSGLAADLSVLQGKPAGTSAVPYSLVNRGGSPLIAAAERQKDAILARPPAAPEPKPAAGGDGAGGPDAERIGGAPEASSTPEAERPAPAAAGPAAEDEAPRPLSVRSFATAIQSMKPSYEPPAAPAAPVAPAQGQAPAARVEAPAPRPLPAFVKQSIPSVPAPAATRASEPARPAENEDATSLEDFLSAELDSDFGEVRWNDEPAASAAPVPRVDPPVERPGAPEVRAEEPRRDEPNRALSLEEEMERLLGDFDFEVSDRRAK